MPARRPAPPLALAAPPAPAAAPAAGTSAAPLRAWLDAAGQAFPERGPVLRCLLLASLSPRPQNVLMIGPPGTGKTTLGEAVGDALGIGVFTRTLTPFSTDDDLLNPVDVAALQAGRMERVQAGSVTDPAYGMILLDELPRAGRGAQAVALPVLAERRTPDRRKVPAHVVAATANTRLTDEDQQALADRFTLRVNVGRVVEPDNLLRVIFREVPVDGLPATPTALPPVPVDVVAAVRARVPAVRFPRDVANAVRDAVLTLRKPPTGAPVDVSERRMIAATHVLQAAAALDDRDVVSWADLDVLRHVLDDGDETRGTVDAVLRAALPAYVAALAAVEEACRDALALCERINVRREAVGKALLGVHGDNVDNRLPALPATLAAHGPAVVAQARTIVDDYLFRMRAMRAARDAEDDRRRAAGQTV